MHLDSADKQALYYYRERREAAALAKTHSARSEKRICHACSRDALIGRETAEISEKKDASKKPSAPCLMYWYFVLCTNGCDLREVSVVGCLGSVEVVTSYSSVVCLRVFQRRQAHRRQATALSCVCVFQSMHGIRLSALACDCVSLSVHEHTGIKLLLGRFRACTS